MSSATPQRIEMGECTISCAPTLATESRHVSLALEPPQFINDNRSTTAGPHDEVEDGLSCCLSAMDGGDAPLSSRVPDHEAAAGSSDLTMHAVTGTFIACTVTPQVTSSSWLPSGYQSTPPSPASLLARGTTYT